MGRRSRESIGTGSIGRAGELATVLLETYAVNDAMNQLLLKHLDPRAWRAEPPGPRGNGRTIGAIFAHLHNSRLVWLKNSAPHLKCPTKLDPEGCTMKQAAAGHRKSGEQCLRMLSDALSSIEDGARLRPRRAGEARVAARAAAKRRVTRFSRGAWVPVWPAGGAMFAYMFSHEAHHRGQIIMLAHQLGYRLPPAAWGGIWQWNKLWKEAGFEGRPR